MARAKRTDRADARRRYRAEMAVDDEAISVDAETPANGSTPARTDRSPAGPADAASSRPSGAAGRIGIGSAFRTAFHPVDLRADLRSLPWLITHSKAVWIPVLLTVGTAISVAIIGRVNIVSSFATTYFLETPAIGGVFIAGFLAPRASWLIGLLVGLLAAVLYSILVFFFQPMLFPPALYTGEMTPAIQQQFAMSALLLSPVFGALFAAGAAWYRRFLALSNPNRGRRAAAQQKRGNDGRTRSGRAQKAGARR